MPWQDLANGTFELVAGLAVWNHARVLYLHKKVRGVSVLSTLFFSSWGWWNLYYYPWLDQWASFTGGLFIMSGNLMWLLMMVHYIKREKALKKFGTQMEAVKQGVREGRRDLELNGMGDGVADTEEYT